jgi:hypothetical protein
MAKKRPRAQRPSDDKPKFVPLVDSEVAEADPGPYTETSAHVAGGDVDADWRRAASVGEEAPGGSVATPDQDRVDDIGEALGVPQEPDEELRSSSEILDERDDRRMEQEP